MKLEINREFARRGENAFATVTLSAEIGEVSLNGKVLPVRSVEYLLNFSLQSLQDAYAGAKNADESRGMLLKKLESIQNGSIGMRGVSETANEETIVQRIVVANALRAKKSAGEKFELPETSVLDAIWAKNASKLSVAFDAELEKRKIARENKRKIAELDLDLSL